MSELFEPTLSKDDIWKAHILKAQASRLSDIKYCEKYQLSNYMFSTYKKKLGFTKSRPVVKIESEVNPFVKAVASAMDHNVQIQSMEQAMRTTSSMPDPQWLAEFTKAILGMKK